ncbi:hypothetical protein GCM10023194_14610 [Planotetraspora phitsanulokensis]
MGEVDDHLRPRQSVEGVVLVDRTHQLHVLRRVHGLADFHTDAPASAQNSDLNHAPKAISAPRPDMTKPRGRQAHARLRDDDGPQAMAKPKSLSE